MSMVTVTVRTAEKVGGSEDKFYRTYELPTCALFQWGSQRNGRSGGQYKIAPASHDAVAQFGKKRNEGYQPVGSAEQFHVDEQKLQSQVLAGAKALGPFLDGLNAASAGARTRATPKIAADTFGGPFDPAPATVPSKADDRIATVNERALAAITLATSAPAKALTEYSLLQDDLENLEQDLRKIRSYLSTLEVLVEEAMA